MAGSKPDGFGRDPSHWLFKFSPDEWIGAALSEVRRAEDAYKGHNAKAGLAGAKRAAGMALNAALIVEPNEKWGRAYVDHVLALSRDESVPEAVRKACKVLLETHAGGVVVILRSPRSDEIVLEAARDLVAHAYAVVKRHEAKDRN